MYSYGEEHLEGKLTDKLKGFGCLANPPNDHYIQDEFTADVDCESCLNNGMDACRCACKPQDCVLTLLKIVGPKINERSGRIFQSDPRLAI